MIKMSNKTEALFNAYRLTIRSMQAHGESLIGEKIVLDREKFRVSGDKVMVIYHRRKLSGEAFSSLNQRQRDCEKALSDNRAKMIELGREIASFCMVVDANTAATERIDAFNMEPGTFDHGIASMAHLIFCGACKPTDGGSNFDVICHALSLACRDYSDNLISGPDVAAIEHVASENAICWFTDGGESSDGDSSDDVGELDEVGPFCLTANSMEEYLSSVEIGSVSFSAREFWNGRVLDDADTVGAYALSLRKYSATEIDNLVVL
jgi:hypothetical protein